MNSTFSMMMQWWCSTRFKQILWTFFSFRSTNFRDINLVLEIQIQISNGELLYWPLLIMNTNIKYMSNTKQIWKTLPRLEFLFFFVWEVALGKILTTSNLCKSDIVISAVCVNQMVTQKVIFCCIVLLVLICGLFSFAKLGLLGLCKFCQHYVGVL